jgi:hypothetical protein
MQRTGVMDELHEPVSDNGRFRFLNHGQLRHSDHEYIGGNGPAGRHDQGKGGISEPMLKLLMQWDIKMGREQEFSEFVVREFAPKLMQLGVEPSEVLYTMYGEGPQMLAIGAVESPEKLQDILQSSGWDRLHRKLLTYVTNYSQKVVRDNGRNFQL